MSLTDMVLMPGKDYQAICDAIRVKTGGTAPLKSGDIAAAIAGIQAGGGGASGIYMAQITPATDESSLTVEHGLGTTDILAALIWAETLGGATPEAANYVMQRTWLKTDIPVRLSSSDKHPNIDIFSTYDISGKQIGGPGQPTSSAYLCKPKSENTFYFYSGGAVSARFMAGVTYTVIIIAASAFAPTEV